jgi:HEAT repeat protein
MIDLLAENDWNRCRVRLRAERDAGRLGPDDLLAACRAAEPIIRRRALLLLAELFPEAVVDLEAVALCLGDRCWPVREAAVSALRRLDRQGLCAERLQRSALRDPEPQVRAAAVPALTPDAVPVLAEALRHRRWKVRWRATQALGGLPGADELVVDALCQALADSDARVRRAALIGLGTRGTAAQRAIPAMQARLGEKDPKVRTAAREALQALGVWRAGSVGDRSGGTPVADAPGSPRT